MKETVAIKTSPMIAYIIKALRDLNTESLKLNTVSSVEAVVSLLVS